MKYYLAIPLILALCLLQAAVMAEFTPLSVRINLPLVVLACWAMVRGQQEAMVLVLAAGLALGVLTSEPLGVSLLALAPLPLIAGLREFKVTENELIPTLIVVEASLLAYYLIDGFLLLFLGSTFDWWEAIYRVVVPESALTLLLAPAVFWLIKQASIDLRRATLARP